LAPLSSYTEDESSKEENMAFTVDNWPVIRSKYYGNTNGRSVRLVVIHDMEAPEGASTAENVARYFAGGSVKASAHLCIDNNSIVRCVDDNDVAYAAPGANNDGIQLELAGYGRQTQAQWLDNYSKGVLENAAKATAQYCLKYGLPVTHISNAELAAGRKGIIGHVQASQVYKKSDHSDPGSGFPWTYFLGRVRYWLPYYKNGRKWPAAPAPAPQPALKRYGEPGFIIDPRTGFRWLGLTNPQMTGNDVNGVRNVMRVLGNNIAATGPYDSQLAGIVAIFQENRGIEERGFGVESLEAAREELAARA
jgi:N-acetyl-anhydromuramyl-L-alanine amidase AmpD